MLSYDAANQQYYGCIQTPNGDVSVVTMKESGNVNGRVDCASIRMDKSLRRAIAGPETDGGGDQQTKVLVNLLRTIEQLTVQQAFDWISRQVQQQQQWPIQNVGDDDDVDAAVAVLNLLAVEIDDNQQYQQQQQLSLLSWLDIKYFAPTGNQIIVWVGTEEGRGDIKGTSVARQYEYELLLPLPLLFSGERGGNSSILAPGAAPSGDAVVLLAPHGWPMSVNCKALPASLLSRELKRCQQEHQYLYQDDYSSNNSHERHRGRDNRVRVMYTFTTLHAAVQAALSTYADYMAVLFDMDTHLWILEPTAVALTGASGKRDSNNNPNPNNPNPNNNANNPNIVSEAADAYATCLSPCFTYIPSRRFMLDLQTTTNNNNNNNAAVATTTTTATGVVVVGGGGGGAAGSNINVSDGNVNVRGNVSVSLTVDPLRPRQLPVRVTGGPGSSSIGVSGVSDSELEFHGPPAVTQRYQQLFEANKHHWDETLLPRENISRVLSGSEGPLVVLPTRVDQQRQEEQEEQERRQLGVDAVDSSSHLLCGICYSYQLVTAEGSGIGAQLAHAHPHRPSPDSVVGEVPTEVCANSRCEKHYHRQCLYSWLVSLPTTKRSFGMLFGKCPFCMDPLNIRMVR